jgi:hypothetical protein
MQNPRRMEKSKSCHYLKKDKGIIVIITEGLAS